MTTAGWQQIEKLFHEALDYEREARTAFLDEACRGDLELRRRIDALLAAHESAGDFIEQTPLAGILTAIASQSEHGPPPVSDHSLIGKAIGHYEIQSLLGSGGMGEVYLANDCKLDRPVALKILPSQFTADLAQVQRFEREARAASALNSPNIITIHEIGHDGQLHFMATEFIEGQTLRREISHRRLPIKKVIDLTAQIATGLSAAHAAGIIHRDIKPENVMVRPDGLVKVLDFGLAKPIEHDLDTRTSRAHAAPSTQTDAGSLMGTVAYLSPEQVQRQKVDHRTDIFSLGVVLYEMLAGSRPFNGGNVAEVLDAILECEPQPIHAHQVSPELNRIIGRALAKDRAARYQTAEELRRDLMRIGQQTESRTRTWVSRAALLAILVLPLAFGVWLWRARRTSPPNRLVFNATAQKLTDLPGEEIYPSLSPDGQSFVFASPQSGDWDIYRQGVKDRAAINLTAGTGSYDVQPVYSPDGARIAFRSSRNGGGLFLMENDGTGVTQLTTEGFNPAWSPDGHELAFNDDNPFNYEGRNTYPSASKLWAVDVTTKARRVITEHDAVQSNWSPHGQRLAFWGEQKGGHRDIWTVAADGGSEPLLVTDDGFIDWNPVWSPDGAYLYFLSNRGGEMNLWRVAIEEPTGRLRGEPEPATLPSNNCQYLSFARNGGSLVYGQNTGSENVWQVGFDPVRGQVDPPATFLRQGLKRYAYFSLAPDEEHFVYLARGEPQQDLFTADRAGTPQHRLTDDVAQDIVPRWSPDGEWIAFLSDRSGKYEIWKVRADGSGLTQMTHEPGREVIAPVWSPDGRKLLYQVRNVNSYIIDASRPGAEQTPQSLAGEPPTGFIPWDWSPDGSCLVGWLPINGGGIVFYDFAQHRYERFNTASGDFPIWLNDNRRVLFHDRGSLFTLDRRTGKSQEILTLKPPAQIGHYAFSRDNRRLYYTNWSNEADIWLLNLDTANK